MASSTNISTSSVFNLQVAATKPSTKVISVLLVNNESLFLQGLRTMLDFYNNSGSLQFNIVGEASSWEQAISLTTKHQPSLILLDIDLSLEPDEGITLLRKLRRLLYSVKLLVLSAHREDKIIFQVMQAGACGYMLKEHLPSQFYDAITTIIDDKIYLCPEMATCFFRIFHSYAEQSTKNYNAVHLTNREQEVLNLLAEGASNEKIAQSLYISIATVKAHLTSIFEKLGVKSRSMAIVKALKVGLV
ncbi:MAG: response regulator transcription factor [Coleofasciculaceae cyanobacterium]